MSKVLIKDDGRASLRKQRSMSTGSIVNDGEMQQLIAVDTAANNNSDDVEEKLKRAARRTQQLITTKALR